MTKACEGKGKEEEEEEEFLDQEKSMSHFKSLGHGTQCKVDLDHDIMFSLK